MTDLNRCHCLVLPTAISQFRPPVRHRTARVRCTRLRDDHDRHQRHGVAKLHGLFPKMWRYWRVGRFDPRLVLQHVPRMLPPTYKPPVSVSFLFGILLSVDCGGFVCGLVVFAICLVFLFDMVCWIGRASVCWLWLDVSLTANVATILCMIGITGWPELANTVDVGGCIGAGGCRQRQLERPCCCLAGAVSSPLVQRRGWCVATDVGLTERLLLRPLVGRGPANAGMGR